MRTISLYNLLLALANTIYAIDTWLWEQHRWLKDTVIARDIVDPLVLYVYWWVYDRYVDVFDYMDQATRLEQFVNGMVTGTLVDQVISAVFPSWVQFRSNPAAWISGYVQQIVAGLGTLLTDPWGWLASLLTSRILGFNILVANAQTWVLDRIEAAWPAFYYLRRDPAVTVWGWIQDRIPDLGQLGIDPLGWLRLNLGLLLGVPDSFFLDPFGYIFQAWLSRFEEGREADLLWLRNQGEHVLRYLLEGVW